jgi:riboflavin biosynthesis pyrimidine reductase
MLILLCKSAEFRYLQTARAGQNHRSWPGSSTWRIWQAADKVVYSRSLEAVSTGRTRLERDFDPGSVRQMKASADRDITVGGPVLAAEAIRAGLVDEIHLIICPVLVGGGKKARPGDVRLRLDLLDERRFGNGVIHLHYRVVN